MDKNYKTIIILLSITVLLLGILEGKNYISTIYNDKLDSTITNHSWKRDNGSDIETINFTENGEFFYYCACGSPIESYDLCDTYKYDKDTNTIKLICTPGVKVTELKIKKVTEYELVLDFNGKERVFETEYGHLIENPLSFAGIEFETTDSKENIEVTFTKTGNFEAFDNTNNKYALGSEVCFNWTYDKETNEITLDCQDHTRTIEIKNYDEKTKELELYFKQDKKTIKLSAKEDN